MRKINFTLKWARSFSYWAPNQQAGYGWLAKRIPEVFRWTMEGPKTQWKGFVNKVSDRLMKKLFPTLPFSTTRVSVTELPFVAIIWIIYDNSTPHWIVVQLSRPRFSLNPVILTSFTGPGTRPGHFALKSRIPFWRRGPSSRFDSHAPLSSLTQCGGYQGLLVCSS